MGKNSKVLILDCKITKWYHTHVGENIEVHNGIVEIDNKYYYESAGNDGFIIDVNDCLCNIELREKKLERILK